MPNVVRSRRGCCPVRISLASGCRPWHPRYESGGPRGTWQAPLFTRGFSSVRGRGWKMPLPGPGDAADPSLAGSAGEGALPRACVELRCTPAVPGRDAAVGPERVAKRLELFRGRRRNAPREPEAFPDPEVARRPDVQAPEPE